MRSTKILKSLLYTATLLVLVSCNNRPSILDWGREPVMELQGDVLYLDEIKRAMPDGLTSSEDSAVFIENYKRKWASDKLLYSQALNNVGNTDEINTLTEAYRKELIISEYLRKITDQNLQTITEDTLLNFYEKNKEHFQLGETVVKGICIKVRSSAPDQSMLSKWLSDINDENLENIVTYCTKHAVFQNLFIDQWIPFSKVNEIMAKELSCNEPAITRGTIVQQSDEYTYYLKITGLCKVGSPQPFELVEENIYNILTNRAKIEYIQQFYNDLYEKAIEKGSIKLYEN
ncbi:MAG: peptidyl-prolyl cis-trans isomerase [Paludibacteraceae bacterium]|nr:peptidyl-prolyl cis-trans isomerase [Paludibacteraceae bacterium]